MMNFLDSQLTSPNTTHTSISPEILYEEIPLKGSKKAYRCTFPECGKLFNFKSETTRHTIIHKDGRPHTCPHQDCNKTFKRIDALKNHLQLHENVLPHLCDVPGCGKRFATKAAIRYHKIKHDNQRVYKCEFPGCEKSFLTPSQLKQHQSASYIHGKKPREPSTTKVRAIESNELDQEFAEIAPKLVEIVNWETKPQLNEIDNGQATNKAKIFDTLYLYLLNENKILKEKMQERQNITNFFENKQTYEFEPMDHANELLLSKGFSLILNGEELKF